MGDAGSGKTLVSEAILERVVAERPLDDPDFRVLYVTSKPYLVEEMRRSWSLSPLAGELPEGMVSFKTWVQVLQDSGVAITEKN
ncbi:hypothetical protein, partial [Legionella sp. CNM-4043-24]|uniref:hypothetical protein n=1 Tax=Legionella sp. CNM-4043-24 TaxID=3421646 RepID=UPI00403AC9B8